MVVSPTVARFNKQVLEEVDIIYTGIPALDDSTGGIMPTDFWVIGASTGVGKSQLGALIAHNSAKSGMKTHLFALEAYEGEIEDRLKFNLMCDKWYKKHRDYVDFRDWKAGKYLINDMLHIEAEVICELDEKIKENLTIAYPGGDYTIEQFETDINHVVSMKNFIDLIVIDHLHYFDLPDSLSENRAIKTIVNRLRDIGLFHEIPIVLISHLRKKERNNKSLIATLEEFHGSSEITKNPTCVITLTPGLDIEMPSPYEYPTYFHIAKNRFRGGLRRYALDALFNLKTGQYSDKYNVYQIKNDGLDLEILEREKIPYWAVSAKNMGHFAKTFNGG